MPSIQQIIAEIQLAQDLPPNHKVKVVQIIRDAEQRLKLKGVKSRPRKASGKNLVTIQEWEEKNGPLRAYMMESWMKAHNLRYEAVADLIDEFCAEMASKGKEYANFKAAFMTYLAKGYLSKTMVSCVKKQTTHIDTRGVTL